MESPSSSAPAATLGMKERFFRFTERFGHMMSRIILTLFYAILVAPAGLILSLLDPLRIRRWRGSSWDDWQHTNETPEQARRQD